MKELQQHVRKYMESGRLTPDQFGDMALLYATLNDPTLEGESFSRLKPYEEIGAGWKPIIAAVRS